MKKIILLSVFSLPLLALGATGEHVRISNLEQKKLLNKIRRIYTKKNDPEILNERPRKYSSQDDSLIDPNSMLKFKKNSKLLTVFEQLAQQKMSPNFLKAQCHWLAKVSPDLKCESSGGAISREGIRNHDRVEDLAATWLDRVENGIDKLPASGESSLALWSDDYWRLSWGATSYRYGEGKYFYNYREAVASYTQPDYWLKEFQKLNLNELNQQIQTWSPAEKYDLVTNNKEFGLTQEQKSEGLQFVDESGDVEGWMGICHGWAAAAMMAPKAIKGFEMWGAEGTSVKWFPHDVRALTSLAWANGYYPSNFVGARCDNKTPQTYRNGRMKDSDCFDNNPATFHLALANLIGIGKASFVMDAAFDYQVWNQPIQAYKFTYFNPLKPTEQSSNWAEVAIPYDAVFKARDRFQDPLTRGERNSYSGAYDDGSISKIVGVIASVMYLGEVNPLHGDAVRNESFIRVSYTYDLELSESVEGYKLIGGEWHTNAHPDFLWVPQKGSVAYSTMDGEVPIFKGDEPPSNDLIDRAQSGSRQGYPLCSVISKLLQSSSVESKYQCPGF